MTAHLPPQTLLDFALSLGLPVVLMPDPVSRRVLTSPDGATGVFYTWRFPGGWISDGCSWSGPYLRLDTGEIYLLVGETVRTWEGDVVWPKSTPG